MEWDGRFSGAAMATLGDRVILFGGERNGFALSETWQWNGTLWAPLLTAHRPPARSRHGLATVGERLVLFGGQGSAGLLDDTWEFDGTDWHELAPSAHPSARANFGLAGFGQRAVLFGGGDDQTWEWDGVTWTRRDSTPRPSARLWPAMAAHGSSLLLFGGAVPGVGSVFGDTWSWDGSQWRELQPAVRPSPRAARAVALGDEVLLFGENDYTARPTDTWSWDGTSWTQRASAGPPGATFRALAALRGRAVLVGGLGENQTPLYETWEWNGTAWEQRGARARPPGQATSMVALDGSVVLTAQGVPPSVELWTFERDAWRTGWAPDELSGLTAWRGRAVARRARGQQLETWEYDGDMWSTANTAPMPPPRPEGRTLVTVGARLLEVGDGMREWDGEQWVAVPGATPPELWHQGSLGLRSIALLWGVGLDGGDVRPEVWASDGGSWALTNIAPFPPGAAPFAHHDALLAVGGASGDGGACPVWRWDGLEWALLEVDGVGPFERAGPQVAMLGDDAIMFGGSGPTGGATAETWRLAMPRTEGCTAGVGAPLGLLAVLGVRRRLRRAVTPKR